MSRALFLPTARTLTACSAGLLLALTLNGSAHADTVPGSARAHYRAGVGHLESQEPDRYALAYREFKEAYTEFPSWKILSELGFAAHGLEREGEATDAFEQYFEKGGTEVPREQGEKVRQILQQLNSERATIIIEAAQTPFWIVDTRTDGPGPIVNRYGPFENRAELRVHAGDHDIRLDGNETSAVWKVHLGPGDAPSHVFEAGPSRASSTDAALFDTTFAPPPVASADERPTPSHTLSYALWGAAGAATVATTVFVLQASHVQAETDDAFHRDCPSGIDGSPACAHVMAMDRQAAHWRSAALVTGLGGAGALIAGTTLYFLGAPSTHGSGSGERETSSSLRAWVNFGGVGLDGTF